MAHSILCPTAAEMSTFLQSHRHSGSDYLTQVSKLVSTYKGKTSALKNPAGATWKVGGLDDTIYKGKDRAVKGWGKFYLPKMVSMQVIGVVEGTSYPCDQLVVMTCEDMKVYAYDGEELHLLASSMEQMVNQGIEDPASRSYYYGEAFKDMTDRDWDKVRKGAVGKSLDQAHHKLVTAEKAKFLAALKPTGACN